MAIFYPGTPSSSDLAAEARALADALARIASDGGPSPDDMADAPTITDHVIVGGRVVPVLFGSVQNHPRLRGHLVRTSEVYAIDNEAGWARTWSRYYRLAPRTSRVSR